MSLHRRVKNPFLLITAHSLLSGDLLCFHSSRHVSQKGTKSTRFGLARVLNASSDEYSKIGTHFFLRVVDEGRILSTLLWLLFQFLVKKTFGLMQVSRSLPGY